MLALLRKKIKSKLQKKTSKKKINIWNIILWINIIGNIPLSLENVKNNWLRIISYFIFLLDEIFNADYRKMLFNYELDSEEVKEYEEKHLKNWRDYISRTSAIILFLSICLILVDLFAIPIAISTAKKMTYCNICDLNTQEAAIRILKLSEKEKMKGGNVFSLLLNNKNNEYIFLVNIAGMISYISKGWIPFLSTYEPE